MGKQILVLGVAAGAILAYLGYKKKQEVDSLLLLDYEITGLKYYSITAKYVYFDVTILFTNRSEYRFNVADIKAILSYKGVEFSRTQNGTFNIAPNAESPQRLIMSVSTAEFIDMIGRVLRDPNPVALVDVSLTYSSNTLQANIPLRHAAEVNIKELAKEYFNQYMRDNGQTFQIN